MEDFSAKCNNILELLHSEKVKEALAEFNNIGEVK